MKGSKNYMCFFDQTLLCLQLNTLHNFIFRCFIFSINLKEYESCRGQRSRSFSWHAMFYCRTHRLLTLSSMKIFSLGLGCWVVKGCSVIYASCFLISACMGPPKMAFPKSPWKVRVFDFGVTSHLSPWKISPSPFIDKLSVFGIKVQLNCYLDFRL